MFQHFAESDDDLKKKQDFMKEFTSSLRKTSINGFDIKVMLCGENNILKTHQDGSFSMPAGMTWPSDYDILLNPTHRSAGRPEIWKRHKHWSENGKTVIQTTNNDRQGWGKIALRVYQNGGELNLEQNAVEIITEKDWRLVILDITKGS